MPNHVSVVGFDDNPLARRTQPALTIVRQEVDAKGRAAAAALTIAIDRAKTRPAGRGRHLILPGTVLATMRTRVQLSGREGKTGPSRWGSSDGFAQMSSRTWMNPELWVCHERREGSDHVVEAS